MLEKSDYFFIQLKKHNKTLLLSDQTDAQTPRTLALLLQE